MKRPSILALVTVVAGLALTGPSAAAAAPNDLQRTAQAVVDAGPVGYLARVNAKDGVHTATAGLADQATQRRLKNKDQYEAGSQTKTFVAVLVLQMVAEKKVALDAPIERYLPGTVPNGKNITVRMLLQHTSGLFNYTNDSDFAVRALGEPTKPIPVEEILETAFSHPADFAPGTGWSYSNTGYVVLGELLQEVTGKPVGELLQQRIAKPLRLRDTYLADPFAKNTGPGFAHAYISDLSTDPATYIDTADWSLSWAGSAGALVSTSRDLSTFYSALLSGKFLPKAQLKQMRTTVDVSEGMGYGLGVYSLETPCGTIWGHDGATFGSVSMTFTTPDGKRSFALDTTTRLYGLDPADPRLQNFAAAFGQAQMTAICKMHGKPVPSGTATQRTSSPELQFLDQQQMQTAVAKAIAAS
ncbi:serine hydrolase domain-containing protein [Kineosporia babensis]|uniref:Beta-lactamase family protein n=1 Tax=Kineosporia babensis TaxID=499548 RepID=A0A9X1STY6_9ACTN|nr:serine hydrolase domain-containing protein [Kineosporia babensis]MCD5312429.1 beta-lactamase family protein [Kineosporia babensis]